MENPVVIKPKGRRRGSRIPSWSETMKKRPRKNVGVSVPNQVDPDSTKTEPTCSNCVLDEIRNP
jgi:hypothetical protein